MVATKRNLKPPTDIDLETAKRAWREGRSKYILEKHTQCYRVMRASNADEAARFASECFAAETPARFSPIRHRRSIVAAAYAGMKPEAALWETALRNIRHARIKRVPARDIRDRYLVRVSVQRDLTLLDIRKPLDSNLVFGRKPAPDLSGAPKEDYDSTRRWAHDLYSKLRGMDGIIYASHQIDAHCIVLFQSRRLKVFNVQDKAQPLNDTPVRGILIREAARVGVAIDFDEPDDY